ncbi:enoyl-CoA hydratase [Desulfosarcina widdelii]|uniref:Enoyl-CoA hydratase n=1 Tax=Desulfosarcina widdelii TaxID=947919 RepID=A0A5K7YXJ2_9BACT|nr:enoyl-CoA hydratase/isomerase family protein [Desulfosarcina widdelii]BBO73060.1 enoyl-CoA hydratase [Desulfosarcina widdelii]
MNDSTFNVNNELFKGEKNGDILAMSFKQKPLLHITDLDIKKLLFHYLDSIACCDEIKVVLIKESPGKMTREEYIDYYKSLIEPGFTQASIERMNNAVNQMVLKLVGLNKMVIHVDSGNVIFLFMSIGLSCDFRIVADNTAFLNPYIELGAVPKGGSVFFLSKMLGAVKASQIFYSGKDIAASEAHHLGIVDNVVPLGELDQAALKTARSYAQLPTGYAIGVKKLLNYDMKELACFLKFENEMLRQGLNSCKLYKDVVDL